MDHKDELNRFLPDENSQPDRLFVEIPADQPAPLPEQIPSGFDPMGEVELRGRVARGLSTGQAPWWIIITGWFIFGGSALLLVHAAIATGFFTVWLFAAIALIPVWIVWQGTRAKLDRNRHRR
jgi:hypothetical protein